MTAVLRARFAVSICRSDFGWSGVFHLNGVDGPFQCAHCQPVLGPPDTGCPEGVPAAPTAYPHIKGMTDEPRFKTKRPCVENKISANLS